MYKKITFTTEEGISEEEAIYVKTITSFLIKAFDVTDDLSLGRAITCLINALSFSIGEYVKEDRQKDLIISIGVAIQNSIKMNKERDSTNDNEQSGICANEEL